MENAGRYIFVNKQYKYKLHAMTPVILFRENVLVSIIMAAFMHIQFFLLKLETPFNRYKNKHRVMKYRTSLKNSDIKGRLLIE